MSRRDKSLDLTAQGAITATVAAVQRPVTIVVEVTLENECLDLLDAVRRRRQRCNVDLPALKQARCAAAGALPWRQRRFESAPC